MDRINWQRTRDILISVICIGIIIWAAWMFMGQFVDAIVLLLLSLAIAFLVTPLVNFLHRYKLPRVLATLIVFLLVLAAIGGIGYELVISLVQQVYAFKDQIVNFANSLSNLPQQVQPIIAALNKENVPVNEIIAQLQAQANNFAQSILNNIIDLLTNSVSVFTNIFVIVVLSFYFTLDGKRVRDSLVNIAPKAWLPNVLLFEDALNRVVGNYIRGQLTLAVIVGACTFLICAVCGLGNFALICGVLAFLFETIPMVGPALASIMPILLSLLVGGGGMWQRTIIVIALFVVLQVLESNVLGPRIVGHAVGLHPIAAILALLVFAHLFGVFGALLATPVVAATWVVISSIYRSARGETADQILAHKRAPWTIHRPNIPRPHLNRKEPVLEERASARTRPLIDVKGALSMPKEARQGQADTLIYTPDVPPDEKS